MEEQRIFFSVIIPTFERPEDLRKCLFSLSADQQEEPLVRVDRYGRFPNGCKPNFGFKGIRGGFLGRREKIGTRGKSKCRSSSRKGEWIIFIDDDCIAQPGYLSAFGKAIDENPSVGLFEGRIFPDRERETWAEGCPANEKGGLFWTSNLCVKKSIFQDIGGMDEQFEVAYEDVDFARRLRDQGVPSLFVHEAAACHPWRSVRRGGLNNWKSKDYETADFVRFLKKHNPKEHEFSFPGYGRNLARILTRDLITCALSYRFRGIDILFFQALVTLKGMILILRHNWSPAK